MLIVVRLVSGSAPFKPTEKTIVKNHTFKVKVAQTDDEKQIGLSETKNLPADYAMIFPFGQSGYYPFWMKNMKFPIDIIYINNNKVVKVFKNVPTPKGQGALRIYVSQTPADTVLEIQAGLSDKYQIKEGDSITIQKI